MLKRSRFGLGLAVSLGLAAPRAWAASEMDFGGGKALVCAEAELGGRKVSVAGARDKFNEYRDVRDGFLVNLLSLKVSGSETPYFLDLKAINAARADESYRIEAGRWGGYRLAASFDRIPHNFSKGKLILSGAGTGDLRIANQIQAGLQAVEQTRGERGGDPRVDTTGEDALQQAIIRNVLSATDPTSFRLDRERGTLRADFNLTRNSKTWVKVSDERRQGTRRIGAGTYERYPQGATGLPHTEDLFFTSGMELAEPLDYRTTSINAGLGVYQKAYSADLEYTFTEFDDKIGTLVWSNPFRNTDATATNSADAPTSNPFNRGRFVRGQLGLPPSSRSHELAASGSVELPWRSRLTGAVGLGLTEQDDLLRPYTRNSAISGVGGAPADITNPAILPNSRFDGFVRTLTQSYLLRSKPTERLAAKAKYRYYDYNNRSPKILFPGYAAFGESFWRTTKNDKGAPVVNDPASYNRQTAELSADYELTSPLTLSAETFWDKWDYRDTRVDSTSELGAGTGFAWRLGRAAKVHGGYRFARRAAKGYMLGNTAGNPEAVGLVNHNWADRKRHRADLGLGLTPTETLTLGVSGQYRDDELGGRERFGLKNQNSAVAAFDLTYEASEALSLSLDYSREWLRSRMQSGAKDDPFNVAGSALDDSLAGDSFNPFSYWNTTTREEVDTVGLEATGRPGEKVELSAGYSFSYSRMDFTNSNPNSADAAAAGFGNGAKLANGVAADWPTVINRLHSVRAAAAYKLLKDLRVGMNYLFERYSLRDFVNTGEYLPGTSAENSTRYVFTGANQFNYTAHVIGTFVAWKF